MLAYSEVGCEEVILFCPGGDVGRLEQLAEVATLVRAAESGTAPTVGR